MPQVRKPDRRLGVGQQSRGPTTYKAKKEVSLSERLRQLRRAAGSHTETFEMVLFDSYEVRERRASYMGDRAVEIGSPAWKPLDRATVETLIGERLL